MTITITVNGIEYDLTNYATTPITIREDLSKVLDTADILLPLTPSSIANGDNTLDMSKPLLPLSKIVIEEDSKTITHFVREDRCERIYDVGDGDLYQHTISTIEQTKLLELRPVQNITVTQPKSQFQYIQTGHECTDIVYETSLTTTMSWLEVTESSNTTILDGLVLKQAGREYTISYTGIFSRSILQDTTTFTLKLYIGGNLVVTKPILYTKGSQNVIGTIDETYVTSVTNESVVLTITTETGNGNVGLDDATLNIVTSEYDGTNELITLDQVIDKALISNKVYDMNDTTYEQEITLDDETRASISNIVSPEFTFAGYTQHKIFEEVGEPIKAIARMEDDVVKYDFVNSLNRVGWTNRYGQKEVQQLTLEQYADSLEINAENVVESSDRQNIVVEPYENGWFTFRADGDGPVQITDENVSLKTRFNTYEIKNLYAKGFLVTYDDATTDPVTTEWNIIDYVVEKQRYDVLPNLAYDATVDRATVNQGKGNTVYFTDTDNRIRGFGYRAPKDTSVASPKEQSIYQIIASVATQVSGKTVSTVEPNGGTQNIDNLMLTQYRVEHIINTTVSTRVFKANAKEFQREATLFSNNTSRLNDSEKLGVYAQSLVNRTGNNAIVINGIAEDLVDVPEIGNQYLTNICTSVNVEIENNHYNFEAIFFDKYTAINKLVAIDSAYRQWEIPNKSIVDRTLTYIEAITVSDTDITPTHNILTNKGLEELVKPLSTSTPQRITYATVQYRFDEKVPTDSDWDTSFDVESEGPVDIKGIGTTTFIQFINKSNWSVDDTKEDKEFNSAESVYDKYIQNDLAYKNSLGRFDSARYIIYSDGYIDNDTSDGDQYPSISDLTVQDKLLEVDVKVIADARERINTAVNIPFFSKGDVNVYNGIGKYNGFAFQDSNADVQAVLFIDEVPDIENTVVSPSKYLLNDTWSAAAVSSTGKVRVDYSMDFTSSVTRVFRGWGLINTVTNELILSVEDGILIIENTTITHTDSLYFGTDNTKGK